MRSAQLAKERVLVVGLSIMHEIGKVQEAPVCASAASSVSKGKTSAALAYAARNRSHASLRSQPISVQEVRRAAGIGRQMTPLGVNLAIGPAPGAGVQPGYRVAREIVEHFSGRTFHTPAEGVIDVGTAVHIHQPILRVPAIGISQTIAGYVAQYVVRHTPVGDVVVGID